MKTINLKTFNIIGFALFTILLVFIFSIFLGACKKDTTTALRTKEIILNPTTGTTISGKAVITENVNHSFNINITLQNTVKDSVMVMHIHNGSIVLPINIAISLSSIKGTGTQATGSTLNIASGISPTGTTINLNYDSIIKPSRYFNVHFSAAQIKRVVANGNIQ